MLFQDRADAGRRLAERLADYAGREDVIVLALPRGGVPVAFEVAEALGAALDIFIVRKLGVPGYEELAMGAIASGGVRVLNDEVVTHLGITAEVIDAVAAEEGRELERREQAYR
ncbi:MAG: phosphoribosyltransferase family protein, partial [Pyrinomonadaceae bacterium]